MSRAWWEEAFGADYPSIYPHRDLPSARREVAFLVEHGVRGRVLDLACGFGRHTAAFLERGIDAIGADYSAELLRAARGLEGSERLRGRLVRADARALPFAEASFDAVTLLFSSFGYFGADGDAAVLHQCARAVRRGGLVALDLMNPARVRDDLVPESRTQRGPAVAIETRELADGGRRVIKSVELRFPDSRVRRWREDVRMYEPHEIDELLADARLATVERHGDFDGAPFGSRAARQIVLARR